MISCHEIHQLIGEYIDGELPVHQAKEFSDHLENCEACEMEVQVYRGIDDQLDLELSQVDFSENIDHLTELLKTQRSVAPSHSKKFLSGWSYALIAALLLAMLSISFGYGLNQLESKRTILQEDRSSLADQIVVAQLVRATGQVEVLVPGEKQWSAVAPNDSSRICEGARVRTGASVLCELNTSGNSKIRLDETAEVLLHNNAEIQVVKGQVWCLAAQDTEMKIEIGDKETSEGPIASFSCPESMEVQCRADVGAATCDSVAASNPPARMVFADMSCSIQAGESVSVDATRSVQREHAVAEAAKIWQLPLLVVGKTFDSELPQTLTKLLAPIGMTKARHLHEQQIRALGPRGAIPLLAFATTKESFLDPKTRRTAVSIGCELADESAIEWLKQLKSDSDPFVAQHADAGLNRLSTKQL